MTNKFVSMLAGPEMSKQDILLLEPLEPSPEARLLAIAERFGGVARLLPKLVELEQLAAKYKVSPKDLSPLRAT